MHSVLKGKKVIDRKEVIKRRNKQIKALFTQVDSGLFYVYVEEQAYHDFLDGIRSKSDQVQAELKIDGFGSFNFEIFCPFKYFCVFLSKISFDRKADVTFRYDLFYVMQLNDK